MRPRRVRPAVLLLAIGCSLTWAARARQADPPPRDPDRPAARARESGSDLPRVRLIATGGTISVRAGARVSAAELLRLVPLDGIAAADAEQFSNTASASLTLSQWLALARRINAVFRQDPRLAAIVVTTGTDTLEETGYFLNLTVRDERPVVLVGAMRNASAADFDGQANLLDAFRVAAAPESRGRGVLAVLNGEIHAARDVAKTDVMRLDAFTSPAGPLGRVTSSGVAYQRDADRRHTAWSEFDADQIEDLPRVDVVLVYQGASGDIIRALVDQGAAGIVIATAGAGSTSGTQTQGIRYAVRKGALVVLSSRIPSATLPQEHGGRWPAGGGASAGQPIVASDLPPLKARILLMLALTRTRHAAEIQQVFREY